MSFRIAGFIPAAALIAPAFVLGMGVAHAQAPGQAATGGGGQMAYPTPLPSGEVKIPAPTARDTGNMAYPSSSGGVATNAPTARDTGNMAYPTSGGSVVSPGKPAAKPSAMPAATTASAPARPTPAGMKAAQELAVAPGSQPVPYVDFGPGPGAGKGTKMSGHKMMHMHHTAVKKASATTAPAAAPAAK